MKLLVARKVYAYSATMKSESYKFASIVPETSTTIVKYENLNLSGIMRQVGPVLTRSG